MLYRWIAFLPGVDLVYPVAAEGKPGLLCKRREHISAIPIILQVL